MGEALITRRGGGVKRGVITPIEHQVIQDDALVGVKNALIMRKNAEGRYTAGGEGKGLHLVEIKEGSVVRVDVSDYDGVLIYSKTNVKHHIEFDPVTGTLNLLNITCFVGKGDGFYHLIDYEYFIFD